MKTTAFTNIGSNKAVNTVLVKGELTPKKLIAFQKRGIVLAKANTNPHMARRAGKI